jgi:ectoine hydroxylase-related dioxygenase (phytanoyl-CoA dioxygenase family)
MEKIETLPYRFPFEETSKWKNHLQEHGFVVVSGVISEDVCKKVIHQMREALCQLSPNLKIDDDSTWSKTENYPFLLHGGMVQYVGHSKFQWEMREKMTEVFTKVWDCEPKDLATSFDGFCYMDGRKGFPPQSIIETAHSDQSPLRDKLWSVQGLLNLNDCGEDDGGLVIIPDTHKMHQEFFKKLGKSDHPDDWYKFKENDKKDPIFQTAIKICGKAGDFMMWDSRTFHCNTRPQTSNIRACIYICQIPKKNIPEEYRKQRAEGWKDKRTSSHHPGDGFRYFKSPEGYDYDEIIQKLSIKEEEMTELQKSLLCTE